MKVILLWIFSFVFTIAIAYYQRTTGPTYPITGRVDLAGKEVKYKLIRSHGGPDDAMVQLKNVAEGIFGEVKYKRLGTNDDWAHLIMTRQDGGLIAKLPHQPPAGKLLYHVTLSSENQIVLLNDEPAVIRFKGDVPAWALIPHVIIMFTAMMMSTRTGLEALSKGGKTHKYAWITLVTLFVGGLILGPVVQKFAFDAFWTGWPFGQDLTDNKTLAAFIFWAIAVWRLKKNPANRTWPLIAMVVLLLVYLIPHSMFGSELDYSTGTIETGK